MQFGRAISFPFRGPHVWPNLGCIALTFLIPVVGALVATGYLITLQKRLIENIDADAPRFNFSRFGDYLVKGVWPFLVTLVLMLAFIPFIMMLVLAVVVCAILLQNHQAAMIAVIVIGALLYVSFFVLIGPLITPMVLKSGLQGDFKAGFDWRFGLDYFKRTGLLTLGTHLLLILMVVPAAILLSCIPYLGTFALITVLMFVQTHINIQLYLTYLDRGGTPIPFQPEPIEPAFPVVMPPPQPPMPPPAAPQ